MATDARREAGKSQDPADGCTVEDRRAKTFAELARAYIERHASKQRNEDIRLLNGLPACGTP